MQLDAELVCDSPLTLAQVFDSGKRLPRDSWKVRGQRQMIGNAWIDEGFFTRGDRPRAPRIIASVGAVV